MYVVWLYKMTVKEMLILRQKCILRIYINIYIYMTFADRASQ